MSTNPAEAHQRLDSLKRQEELLVFPAFTEETALAVGLALVDAARARHAPVVIDIRTPDRTLFHAALPGSTPDNGHWARRKGNVTLLCHQSSLRVGEGFRLNGGSLADRGLDPADFAAHGGSFPVRVSQVGVIGAIAVSGLPAVEDHGLIVEVLGQYLRVTA